MIDLFSKMGWAYHLPDGTAGSIIKALKEHFTHNRKPKIIQSDNGPEFKIAFDNYLKSIGVKHIKSQPYKPTSQGGVERFNRTFKQRLYHYMSIFRTKTYIDLIPKILEGYNNSKHSTTKKRPIDVYNSVDDAVITEVGDNIQGKANKIKTSILQRIGFSLTSTGLNFGS